MVGGLNTRTLHVFHVITGLGQGGAESALCRLVENDHFHNKITVVSLTGRGVYASRLEAAGATVIALSISGFPSLVKGFALLYRVCRGARPDVIQTWMYHSDLLGGVVARLLGIPVAWGLRQSNLSSQHVKLGTRLVAKFNALTSGVLPAVIVACGEKVAQYHQRLGYKGRMVVIQNGLDLTGYRNDTAKVATIRKSLALEDLFVVGHVSRADTQKDHGMLLRAFGLFLKDHPNSRLIMIGSGLDENSGYLAKYSEYAVVKNKVLALGPRNDLPVLFQLFDLFVLSSVSEGFPNVVAEAMASGVPCAVTDCGDAALMVGGTGWVTPVMQADVLAAALSCAVAEAQPQRIKRKEAVLARAQNMFGIQRMVDSYQLLWTGLVK